MVLKCVTLNFAAEIGETWYESASELRLIALAFCRVFYEFCSCKGIFSAGQVLNGVLVLNPIFSCSVSVDIVYVGSLAQRWNYR